MGISKYITHLNRSRINHQSPFIFDDYFFCSTFERQHPPTASNMPGFSIFPAYCCSSSGNTAWNQPFKIGFQTAAQLHSFQQIECRVTNIQYLLIRSPRLLLFSVNTEWLSPLVSAFVLFLFPLLLLVLCASHFTSLFSHFLLNLHTLHAHLSPSSSLPHSLPFYPFTPNLLLVASFPVLNLVSVLLCRPQIPVLNLLLL